MNRSPSSASPAQNRARSSACASQTEDQRCVVLGVGVQRPDQRRRCGPPAAGRRPAAAAGRWTARPAWPAAARRPGAPAGPASGAGQPVVEDEQHVGVRAVAESPGRRAGPSRSPRTATPSSATPSSAATSRRAAASAAPRVASASSVSPVAHLGVVEPGRAGRRTRSAAARPGAAPRIACAACASVVLPAGRGAHQQPRAPAAARGTQLRRRRPASATPPARAPAGWPRTGRCPAARASRDATVPSSRSSRRNHGRGAERVGDLPVGQQAGVRVGRVGQLGQDHRQQRALQRRPPRQPRGQRLDVPQRPGRVGVAERLQPPPGLVRGQPQRLGGHPGDRLQQRPVEQLLVQPADLAGVQRPLRAPHRRPRRPGRPAGSPSTGPAAAPPPRRRAPGGSGAAWPAAAGARRRAGTRRRRPG